MDPLTDISVFEPGYSASWSQDGSKLISVPSILLNVYAILSKEAKGRLCQAANSRNNFAQSRETIRGSKMSKSIMLIIALSFILVGCLGETGPEDVVSLSTEAYNDGNLAEAIGYYTDDAEVKFTIAIPRDSKDTYKGKEELLSMFEEMSARKTRKEVDIQDVDGIRVIANARISDIFTAEHGIDPLEYEEVYTFQNDKIRWVDSTIDRDSVVNYMQAVPFEQASIFGKWRIEDGGFAQFNGDNTYQVASRLSDLENGSADSGTYKFDGSLVTFTSDENSSTCQSGDVGTHLLKVLKKDQLQVVMLEEQCDYRRSYVVELTRIDGDS